ncbi:putative nuclease HARBI1 isoform X1 [Rhipicephalus microplus]|uniref:putative nuclease HARBI1 isoform X1 n=1 Tax=Rhipicephalus microplus TaxID=6941 RepID=UPI001886E509|nr:putative nuclease HARBI1 isoform X1 [Rhipicephalus microplus]XP_037268987.1 putative nuclease HARBI1 isoform X1 [Rhipicephalus microplus]XP_037269235.1 putative nuclease HARBI1 isoform X1 [Rhipicephalus microplus]XP_037269352.1 putative nuclease HARBI1 isoform X1 [Rhipicephalus microplus]XP_037273999.1 putative nuclease HARBI1 isoform X1 [Rhipicephalus microplus]XP_037274541.1 putative nuclease HARBI1 isoform X1 [Rhipicephalus microplus]XP_037275125.1 putative nuclease HARBI1 isoform X1 [R
MAAFAALAELLSSDESTSSSSSSSSDDEDFEERQALCEAFFRETFSESHRERPKILGFIENVARLYTDEQVSAELPLFIILHEPNFIFLSFPSLQFRQDFRVSRRVAETLIRGFEGSRHYPCSDRGGSPSKTAEEHILVFLWFAANKACLRDVAGRFGMATATAFRVVERTLEYFLDIAEEVISFPGDLDQLSADFEQVSGVPNTIGCIDGSYISIRCPAKKVRSTYVNRHSYPSLTLQALCDHKKKFLDVTTGHPSKIHDSRIFRTSRLSSKLPHVCCSGKYHVLGDAAYPLRDYLITPFRNYGHLDARQRAFNYHFSATRVKIENAFGDLKARFRQLLHLDFLFVDKMNKFIIACCVLHNMCINCGDVDVPPYIDDEHAPWEWEAQPDDVPPNNGPLASTEDALRRQGEEKRERLMQAMRI